MCFEELIGVRVKVLLGGLEVLLEPGVLLGGGLDTADVGSDDFRLLDEGLADVGAEVAACQPEEQVLQELFGLCVQVAVDDPEDPTEVLVALHGEHELAADEDLEQDEADAPVVAEAVVDPVPVAVLELVRPIWRRDAGSKALDLPIKTGCPEVAEDGPAVVARVPDVPGRDVADDELLLFEALVGYQEALDEVLALL